MKTCSLCGNGVVGLAGVLVPASPGNDTTADGLASPLVKDANAITLAANEDGRVLCQTGVIVRAVGSEEGGDGSQRRNVVAVGANMAPRAPVVGPAGQVALQLNEGCALLVTA